MYVALAYFKERLQTNPHPVRHCIQPNARCRYTIQLSLKLIKDFELCTGIPVVSTMANIVVTYLGPF